MNNIETLHHDGPAVKRGDLESAWKWFVGLGVLMLLVGIVAFGNLLIASVASVLIVGMLMLFAGLAQIIEAFQVRGSGGFVFWLLGGLIYGFAGFFAFANPLLAAGVLTLLLAFSLVVAGVLRLLTGLRAPRMRGWGWIAASAVLTILIGMIVALGWPTNAVWVLGMFLAVDLTFTGAALLILGLTLRTDRAMSRTARAALQSN